MKPITTGKEGDNFTLYYPIYISDNIFKINLDQHLLVNVLCKMLQEKIAIEVVSREDIPILKISNIEALDDAKKIFNILQKYFINLAIQKSITIYLDWEFLEHEPCPFQFFSSWPAAKQKGWDTGEDESFNVDGIVDITRPCIVPEDKKIVDADVLIGRPGSRAISREDLFNSIVEEPLPQLNDRQNLAINAFLASFSLPDQRLAYLLIFISLEVLAGDHCKVLARSKRKHLSRLLSDRKEVILKEINPKYHSGFDPKSKADDLYDLRNEIAHGFTSGSITRSAFYEIYHIAKACATAVIKKIMNC
ncbi:MAG: hypothetical protein CEE38_12805 [Planctomycetes bacterium B3_Pla]|nr:MAG: hypothetical protein CEE38_12805 [Planctomycetes bacterium B3_Pla]